MRLPSTEKREGGGAWRDLVHAETAQLIGSRLQLAGNLTDSVHAAGRAEVVVERPAALGHHNEVLQPASVRAGGFGRRGRHDEQAGQDGDGGCGAEAFHGCTW
jgi:hypothetical protein